MDRNAQSVHRLLMRLRLESKALENRSKPPLNSADVLKTGDFVFSPFHPRAVDGDSGSLLLAKRKDDRSIRYVVKHEYTDCAANEFVYTNLAQAMNLKMPRAVLFQISPGEKRRYWKTEYILGVEFLDLEIEQPTYAQIRERARNWQDYFGFLAMYDMCMESDSFETPLAADGCIYRIDTSDAFVLSDYMLCMAGVHEGPDGISPHDALQRYIETYDYASRLSADRFTKNIAHITQRYGRECAPYYAETFRRFIELRPESIDRCLNTLCYFYPDMIGDYFKRYLTQLALQSERFLKDLKNSPL